MSEKSRTEYSARNTTVAMAGRITAILLGFVARVVFTHTLSEDYVGINGLFTDILSVLALSELGIGTAITYALYKPIAEKDIEKQKSLMLLYRRFYRIVTAVVVVCGLLVIPFMDVLIKDQPDVPHLTLIYIMYLTNAALSYVLIYKKTLVDAHQLSYLGVLYQTTSWVIQNALQIVVLLTTRNYYLYLSILILCTLGNNICISRKADKLYPYLRDKNVTELSVEERKGIFANMRAMLMHKVGNVMVNNTDNLLLSALVGTLSVGRYSNYFLIIGSVKQVLEQMFQGITASVGNMGVQEGRERIRKIFEASFFLGQWIYGLVAICIYQCIDLFVGFSFGQQYVFDKNVTLILCINFYLTGMRQPTLVFRDSMGLFKYDRYKSLVEAVINLVTSLILGKYFGTAGVFLGTMISTVTTSLWVEPYMLYKHKLEISSRGYFVRYFVYGLVTALLWWGETVLCSYIRGNAFVVCVLRLLLCMLLTNGAYLLLYHRTAEFRLLWKKGMGIVKSRFGKRPGERPEKEPGKQNPEKQLTTQEKELLELLRTSLLGKETESPELTGEILDLADRHSVTPLLYPIVEGKEQWERVRRSALVCCKSNFRLLFLSKYLTQTLREKNIAVVLLKGMGTAAFYPVPEYRKSGDVDLLLLHPEQLDNSRRILEEAGLTVKANQTALHHLVLETSEGIEVELHTMLAEPFDNEEINRYLEKLLPACEQEWQMAEIMGVELPVLKDGFHAYELLLHMLQHFLRSGFGLKLLCDWVVFWNHGVPASEREKYGRLVEESGLGGFSDRITEVCVEYLGLMQENAPVISQNRKAASTANLAFMKEILVAEEFGKSGKDRMVALRGSGIRALVIEFHHQMHLNYPVAGRLFLLWPGLWLMTLLRFLHNNRKIRKTSAGAIFRKARERGELIEDLDLWKKARE